MQDPNKYRLTSVSQKIKQLDEGKIHRQQQHISDGRAIADPEYRRARLSKRTLRTKVESARTQRYKS